jgi:hypothetical protein
VLTGWLIMSDDPDKPVGYGNPPKHTRFRKGGPQPKRLKKAAGGVDMYALLGAAVKVGDGDLARKMHPHELALRNLATKAIKGDMRALELLLVEFERYGIIGAQTTASRWPQVLYRPIDYDPAEWNKNLALYGPPPWPLEHDGLPRIEKLRDAARR